MRRVVVEHCGREYEVEVESGPFKLAANKGNHYDGWVTIRPNDPYSEPYKVVFREEDIKREL
jgi:hypothetical protein